MTIQRLTNCPASPAAQGPGENRLPSARMQRGSAATGADRGALKSIAFEIFGKVQGVWFRKYTEAKAKELKLVGWVANTAQGTVKGQVQGDPVGLARMKYWLERHGSPKSRIDKALFTEEEINGVEYKGFEIRR